MILAELEQLPKSLSNGPSSWTEAFGNAVSATDQVMTTVENINASQENFRAAYQSYIDEVQASTGVKIDNPMDIDMRRGTFEARPNPTMSGGTGTEWIEERQRVAMQRFEQQRNALMQQFPAQARLIQLDIDGRATRRMQDAKKAEAEALAAPELGAVGRFAAGLVGGLTGSAKDPYQWATAVMGGGAGTSRTVAGRIGQVMLTEALVNGGTEAVLQAASQERKKRAGIEHGLEDALKNVGIAATFGALFGGTIQGGSELARIYKLGEGGAEVATRVLEGRPEPGDVETLAKAMNVDLSPDRLEMLSRSFEERVLDDVTVPRDATPAQMKVYEAALRYAEDPDNNLPPDLVERLYADDEAGRLSTLTADEYERAYGGDQDAIDNIADTFFAEDLERATRQIDSATMRAEDAALRAERAGDQSAPTATMESRPQSISSDTIEGARIRPERLAEPLDDAAIRYAEEQAGEFRDPEVDPNGNYKSLYELLPFEDGDGNVTMVPISQALEIADEDAFHADLLEACKL